MNFNCNSRKITNKITHVASPRTLPPILLTSRRKLHTYPIVTSNKLLPIELDTAMSPKPFLATKTLVIRSGILVPAAKNVKPMTCKETN